MGSKVGAKVEIFKLLKEGKRSEQEIRVFVEKKFPNVKKYSINKYFADYYSNNPRKEVDQIPDHTDVPQPDNNASSVRLSDIVDDQSKPAETSPEKYAVSDFQYEVVDTETPAEAARMAQRYKDGLTSPEPVKLEFVPKIFKRAFVVIKEWKPLKERLIGWEDQKSVDDLAEEIENSIKKRVHASTKNADLINVGLAAGVVAVSMGAHIITGKKQDIKAEVKTIQKTSPKVAHQIRSMDKEISSAHSQIKQAEKEIQMVETQNGKSNEIDKTRPEIVEHLTADPDLDNLGS